MNYRLIFRLLGRVLLIEALALIPSLAISLHYTDGASGAFLVSLLIVLAVGVTLSVAVPKSPVAMQMRDGFVAVAISWVTLSLFGALPFVISGAIPNYIDALFEVISGFTTTGSSVVANIEALPASIVFWRSFTHWLGGMGVLIFALAILPSDSRGVYNLMRAESTGPTADRIVPKVRQAALILYAMYLFLSVLQTVLLMLGGMGIYDALIHMFGTAGTGGFSSKALSVGAYNSAYIETVIGVFLLLFSINFGLYFAVISRKFREVGKNTELRVFLGIVAASIIMIMVNLLVGGGYTDAGRAGRDAFFQVTSVVSSAGFATADFNLWPDFSRVILLLLMVMGASAGSTGGGLKVARVVIMVKAARRELKKILHPRSVNVVKMNGRAVQEQVISGVMHYFVVYLLLLLLATLLISVDNLGLTVSFSAALTTLSNIGPGFGLIGPMGNFDCFSYFSKIILSFCMLLGRLEIFPVLMLLLPSTWRTRTANKPAQEKRPVSPHIDD